MTDTLLHLADIEPSHQHSPMDYHGVDVARLARQLERKPAPVWRTIFGLHPRGLARLLRTMWVSIENANKATRSAEHKLRVHEFETSTVMWRLDQIIALYDARDNAKETGGFIVMSEGQFAKLDHEYDCIDRTRYTTGGDRMAFTYKGFPIFTARDFIGPVIMTPTVFAAFRPALAAPVLLREK